MFEIFGVLSTAAALILSAWVFAKIFACIYVAVIFSLSKLVEVAIDSISEKHRNWVHASFIFLVKPIDYYLVCIWPAFVVTWIIIPNILIAPWWIYLIAFVCFMMAACVNNITMLVFFLFSFKPELINLIYGWVPLKKFFMYYPW